jgi:hypothetical protein
VQKGYNLAKKTSVSGKMYSPLLPQEMHARRPLPQVFGTGHPVFPVSNDRGRHEEKIQIEFQCQNASGTCNEKVHCEIPVEEGKRSQNAGRMRRRKKSNAV